MIEQHPFRSALDVTKDSYLYSSATGTYPLEYPSLDLTKCPGSALGWHTLYSGVQSDVGQERTPKTAIIWTSDTGISALEHMVANDLQEEFKVGGMRATHTASIIRSACKYRESIAQADEFSGWSELNTASHSGLFRSLKAMLGTQPQELDEDIERNEFTSALSTILWQGGKTALHQIKKIIDDKSANPEAISAALEVVGEHPDPRTKEERFRLLVSSLRSRSRWIRDGASLGLAALTDLRAISYIEEAIANEPIDDLRDDMSIVLNYLGSNI